MIIAFCFHILVQQLIGPHQVFVVALMDETAGLWKNTM
jgi:hypothetical protein